MSTQQLLTKSAFARMVGVSPAAITKALGKQLAAAKVGKFIDAGHPDAVAYLQDDRGESGKPKEPAPPKATKKVAAKATKKAVPKAKKADASKPEPKPEPKPKGRAANKSKNSVMIGMELLPAHIKEYADLPLRELIEMFGTDQGFKSWLDSAAKIEDLKGKQVKNALDMKDLIKWDIVERAFIAPVNELFVKLLTDCVDSVTVICMNAARSGEKKEACELLVREKIESFLLQLKRQWERSRELYV